MQGCRFSDFCRNSDFFFFPFFFLFFFVSFPPCMYCIHVTTMRVNWWLSGQFWLRKSSSFKGPSPPWTPTRALPLDPAGGSAPQTPGQTIISYFFEQSQWHPCMCIRHPTICKMVSLEKINRNCLFFFSRTKKRKIMLYKLIWPFNIILIIGYCIAEWWYKVL